MEHYQDYLDAAAFNLGVDMHKEAPKPIKKFFAMKNGEVTSFDDHKEALAHSKLVETIVTNEKEIKEFWLDRTRVQERASSLFHIDLRKEYKEYSDEIYDIMYSKAYEDGHSAGYDEVANYMIDMSNFVNKILKAAGK